MAAAPFDFNEFKTQYDLKQSLSQLTTFLSTATDPHGDRLIPNGPNDPLTALIASLQLTPAPQAQEFDFELRNITLKEVERLATAAGRNYLDCIDSKCGRAFYNTNLANPQQPAVWRECSRPEASDFPTECSKLLFLDLQCTIVDWSLSLPKLKTLAADRVYTAAMMKESLLKLVNKYHPDQTTILSDKSANQIGTFLLQMDANRDKTIYHRQKLHALYRAPHEDLNTAITKATALINKIYPDTPANQPMRSTSTRIAILSFIPDHIALPIIHHIQKCHTHCEPLTDAQITDMAYKAEEFSKIRPTTNLQYGRPINNTPLQNHIQLNNMQPYHNPYHNPYQIYPPYLPINSDHHPAHPIIPPPVVPQPPRQPLIPQPIIQPHPTTPQPAAAAAIPQTGTHPATPHTPQPTLIYTHPSTTNPRPTVMTDIPTPAYTMRYQDIPHSTQIFNQADKFVAMIGKHAYLIHDHPKLTHGTLSPITRNLTEEFDSPANDRSFTFDEINKLLNNPLTPAHLTRPKPEPPGKSKYPLDPAQIAHRTRNKSGGPQLNSMAPIQPLARPSLQTLSPLYCNTVTFKIHLSQNTNYY
jgi:hypothetical protein